MVGGICLLCIGKRCIGVLLGSRVGAFYGGEYLVQNYVE